MRKQKQTIAPSTPDDFKRIADSVARISDSAKAMRASGLSRNAILVLIKHATSLPMGDIRRVLDAAENLRTWCLSK